MGVASSGKTKIALPIHATNGLMAGVTPDRASIE